MPHDNFRTIANKLGYLRNGHTAFQRHCDKRVARVVKTSVVVNSTLLDKLRDYSIVLSTAVRPTPPDAACEFVVVYGVASGRNKNKVIRLVERWSYLEQ